MSHRVNVRKAVGSAAALVLFLCFAIFSPATAAGAEMKKADKANYDLASRWQSAKVAKLVFDTSVSPHWLETGDRFWYTYETGQGRKWYLVDPLAKTKKLLFDNAKMAAGLTRVLLSPYDAQHLPIKTIKFIKKDTAIQFEIEVPKDNDISLNGKIVKASEIAKEEEAVQDKDKEKEKEKEQDTQKNKDKEAEKPKEPEKKTKLLAFTYELATGKLTLLEDYKEPLKRPRWASVSPDEKTVIFARGHNLFRWTPKASRWPRKKPTTPRSRRNS